MKIDLQRAVQLAHELRITTADCEYFFDDDLGVFEHVMHEYGHAALLDLPVTEGLEGKVSLAIGKLPLHDQQLQEATILVAEQRFFTALGHPIHDDSVLGVAYIQHVAPETVEFARARPEVSDLHAAMVCWAQANGILVPTAPEGESHVP